MRVGLISSVFLVVAVAVGTNTETSITSDEPDEAYRHVQNGAIAGILPDTNGIVDCVVKCGLAVVATAELCGIVAVIVTVSGAICSLVT